MKTWILVADESRARLFESSTIGGELVEVADFVQPGARHPEEGHPRERVPRAHASIGSARQAIEPRTSTDEKMSHEFASSLSEVLNEGRVAHRYERLVLVSPPAFLGVVRGALDPQVARLVSHAVDKNVSGESPERIREALRALP